MKYNITFSTVPFIGKAAYQQKNILWREESVTIEEFVAKIRAGYLYSNCTYKPFNRLHPERGYITQSDSPKGDNIPTSIHGMARTYLSYWYMYSFSIVTFDVDGSHYSPEEVYRRLSRIARVRYSYGEKNVRIDKKSFMAPWGEEEMVVIGSTTDYSTMNVEHYYDEHYCPTLIYTTHSDKPEHRCYRILYFLDAPVYSEPINPFYDKEKDKYLWGEIRWKAGKSYLNVYNDIKEQIQNAVPELIIDDMSHVAVQTYNGNSSENFMVVGEYKIFDYVHPLSPELMEKYNFSDIHHEPIDNFLSKSYIKNIKEPRLERQKRIRSIRNRVNKTYRKFVQEQRTAEETPKTTSAVEKSKESIMCTQLFGDKPLDINLPTLATTNRAIEPDLLNYEMDLEATSIPDASVLSLNDEEFEACSEIGRFYKKLKLSNDVRLAYPEFLKEFFAYGTRELFYRYKDRYPNVWQSCPLNYKAAFDYPDDYKVIYNTLEWKFNPLMSHKKAMKMNDGDNRKFHITALSVARRILSPGITFDHLLFNAMVDSMFLVCNYKKETHEKCNELFTRETVARCVARAWNTDCTNKLYKKIDYLISQHPKTHLKYDKVTAMTIGRKEKAVITEQRMTELYDHTLRDKENLEKFAENGLNVSLITLKRFRKKKELWKREK
jgi:hypothetical protein